MLDETAGTVEALAEGSGLEDGRIVEGGGDTMVVLEEGMRISVVEVCGVEGMSLDEITALVLVGITGKGTVVEVVSLVEDATSVELISSTELDVASVMDGGKRLMLRNQRGKSIIERAYLVEVSRTVVVVEVEMGMVVNARLLSGELATKCRTGTHDVVADTSTMEDVKEPADDIDRIEAAAHQ
jgi:hypothetical protein